MKKYSKHILFLCAALALLIMPSSCDKYLDITPRGYVIPTTVEDYDRMLNDASLTTLLSRNLDELGDTFYLAGASSNTLLTSLTQRVYFWLATMYTPTDAQSNSPWHRCYGHIYQYNAIIENIDQATNGTAAQKAETKALARLGRAITYFYLVNLYAPPYDATTAENDLGLPLVLSAASLDTSTLPARSSLAETYGFILREITESIPYLPPSSRSRFILRQPVAYAFLARIYLYMAAYNNAVNAVSKALETDNSLLDYNEIMTTVTPGAYTYDLSSFSPIDENPENIYIIQYTSVYGMNFTQITDAYYQTFLQNQDDLRRAFFSNSYYPNRDNTYTDTRAFQSSIGPTVPEMYLIRAEAHARLGNTASALADLNYLRQHRISTTAYIDLQSDSPTTVTGWVLDERQRELVNRGLRWFDMRRLNSDPDFGFTARRYLIDDTLIELEPNSLRYTLQIPIDALTDRIIQNPS